jgi:NTP pyrophosphatase (non-canonical NTP hydrolase)
MASDIDRLIEQIKKFNMERDWDQFHNPKDIILALVSEVGELAECYRWLSEQEIAQVHSDPEKKRRIEEEIADIMINLLMLSYKTNTDIVKATEEKIEKNKRKYPVEKAKGKHSNFIQGFKGKG